MIVIKNWEKCLRCNRPLENGDVLLCPSCYRAFFKWSVDHSEVFSSRKGHPLEIWLKEEGKKL